MCVSIKIYIYICIITLFLEYETFNQQHENYTITQQYTCSSKCQTYYSNHTKPYLAQDNKYIYIYNALCIIYIIQHNIYTICNLYTVNGKSELGMDFSSQISTHWTSGNTSEQQIELFN